MLFHATMTHTPENCPGYNPDITPKIIAASENLDTLCKQFNVKLHFLVIGLPEHVEFALLEAESPVSVANFLTQAIPYRSDFKVTAVQHMDDVVTAIKAKMEQMGQE